MACVVAMPLVGCSREKYRSRADRETYAILHERSRDARWQAPPRSVEPAIESRLRDPADPDHSPLPPDDQAASTVLATMPCRSVSQRWPHRGAVPSIEDFRWRTHLPTDPKGNVSLRRDNVVGLALLHSREYQTEIERVYLTALALTLQRFEYAVQWTGINRTFFDHFGVGENESNRLSNNSNLGFAKSFAAGGQLVVDFANSLVWEFSGTKPTLASSNLLVAMSQPLLRGAFARIRVQELTLAEREVLYSVRDFTRFRRQFYVDVMSGGGFLQLLLQTQGIRNIEANLASLERNLREHENLEAAGLVARIQVDQVFQQYQQGKLRLLTAQASLQTSLDEYKLRLGLPPDLELTIDDAPLETFGLNDPKLDELTVQSDALYLELLQPDVAPSKAELAKGFHRLEAMQTVLFSLLDAIDAETARWNAIRSKTADRNASSPEARRETRFADQIQKTLADIRRDLQDDRKETREGLSKLASGDADVLWKQLRDLVGNEFRTRLADAFVTETQIRTLLIELTELRIAPADAVEVALGNRLDLMNRRGRVTDAWRNVEVAADSLQAGLDLNYEGNLRTDVDRDGVLRLDASNSSHRVGVTFNSPLNRLAERNRYRASQIEYQRIRRDFMETEDRIRAQVRRDVRELDLARLQFDIVRQQLVVAARQVEQAQFNLRTTRQADSSVTQDLLGALQSLLEAKNSLVGAWVAYESARMNLYRDLDIMEIDPEGVWTNEREPPGQYGREIELVDADPNPGQIRSDGRNADAQAGQATTTNAATR